MGDTKFTPGSWVSAKHHGKRFGGFDAVSTEDGTATIAIVYGENKEVSEANAAIIAAAPELFYALTGKEEDPHLYAVNWLATLLRVCKKEKVLDAIIADQGGDTDSVLIMLGELDALVKNGNAALSRATDNTVK